MAAGGGVRLAGGAHRAAVRSLAARRPRERRGAAAQKRDVPGHLPTGADVAVRGCAMSRSIRHATQPGGHVSTWFACGCAVLECRGTRSRWSRARRSLWLARALCDVGAAVCARGVINIEQGFVFRSASPAPVRSYVFLFSFLSRSVRSQSAHGRRRPNEALVACACGHPSSGSAGSQDLTSSRSVGASPGPGPALAAPPPAMRQRQRPPLRLDCDPIGVPTCAGGRPGGAPPPRRAPGAPSARVRHPASRERSDAA